MMDAAGAASLDYEGARYTRGAIWLHWIIATLIVVNLLLGFLHEDFGRAALPIIMTIHKSTGFTILALTLVRVGWRFRYRPPPPVEAVKPWEAGLARAVHALFYVLLLVLPLTGWLTASYSKVPVTKFYWLFNIGPLPVTQSDATRESMAGVHEWLGYAMLLLLVLHVAGAVKHHIDGHREAVRRMAPWLYSGR